MHLKNKKKIILLCFALFYLLVIGCSKQVQESAKNTDNKTIQIKGSDTMVNLVQAWAEELSKENSTLNFGITGGGSGTGIAGLINKTCDIAMSSRSIEQKEINLAKEKNINPQQFIVALDGLVVIIHSSNPVSNLTMDELRDIFLGNITNWKELGGKDSKIVILSRESNSGTHVFFKEHVLKRGDKKNPEEFSPSSLLMPSSQAICEEVEQNPHAVGYVGMGYICNRSKAIHVAKNKKTRYIEPTIDSVVNNSYPISRPLYLYADEKHSDVVNKFIDFALSPVGQEIVRKIDFVPMKK